MIQSRTTWPGMDPIIRQHPMPRFFERQTFSTFMLRATVMAAMLGMFSPCRFDGKEEGDDKENANKNVHVQTFAAFFGRPPFFLGAGVTTLGAGGARSIGSSL